MLRHINAPGGVSIACEVSGRGPALVLVHGAGSGRWGFDLVRPLLEDSFTVMAVDRRGRGDSGHGEEPYAIEQEFADVAAVVTEAGPGAILFGHSYGGLVSAGAAGLLPGLETLVLYEPPMGGVLAAESWIERYERQLEEGDRPAAVRSFLTSVGGYSAAEIDEMEGTPAWARRLAVASTVPRELWAERALTLESLELGEVGARCLMFVGSDSPAWAQRSTEAYAGALSNVRVHRLEGHGHGGMTSAPDLIAGELILVS